MVAHGDLGLRLLCKRASLTRTGSDMVPRLTLRTLTTRNPRQKAIFLSNFVRRFLCVRERSLLDHS